MKFISTTDLIADTYRLASLLPSDVAGVVGIARSGILPASLLSQHLHLPMWILRQDTSPSQEDEFDWDGGDVIPVGNGWRLHERQATAGPILVIDDTQMTGRSLERAKPVAEAWARQRGRELLWAVVYQSPGLPNACRAAVCVHELTPPHFLEWNLFNSLHVNQAGFDIDGILCDENAPHERPALYAVRKQAMPLVVTGRCERHRAFTLDWMARWGMTANRLEMWPGDEPPTGIAAAEFKAEHFWASDLEWFVESCPHQAQIIANISAKPVICPAARRVFTCE